MSRVNSNRNIEDNEAKLKTGDHYLQFGRCFFLTRNTAKVITNPHSLNHCDLQCKICFGHLWMPNFAEYFVFF